MTVLLIPECVRYPSTSSHEINSINWRALDNNSEPFIIFSIIEIVLIKFTYSIELAFPLVAFNEADFYWKIYQSKNLIIEEERENKTTTESKEKKSEEKIKKKMKKE